MRMPPDPVKGSEREPVTELARSGGDLSFDEGPSPSKGRKRRMSGEPVGSPPEGGCAEEGCSTEPDAAGEDGSIEEDVEEEAGPRREDYAERVGERARAGPSDAALAGVVQLLDDRPSAPFSIHNFVATGAPYGLESARWVGPFAVCKTLELLVNKNRPGGLRACVAADPYGGVPTVYKDTVARLARGGQGVVAGGVSEDPGPGASGAPGAGWEPLILLAPVTLGATHTIAPGYLAQLCELFSFPQSLGVVGGRTGSSLYFVGCQGERLMYLDPHVVQDAVQDPAEPSGAELGSYRCPHILHMDIGNLNPSLAMGFLCASEDAFEDLCARIEALAERFGAAPLMTVQHGAQAGVAEYTGNDPEEGSDSEGDWQLM